MPKAIRILPSSPLHNLAAGDLVDRLGARKPSRRNLLRAVGAIAGGSALAGTAAGAIGTSALLTPNRDAELLSLVAEEDRLWRIVGELQDEASRRTWAVSEGQAEIGWQRINGEVKPIYATTEEDAVSWFDRDPRVTEISRAHGIYTETYDDRRAELLAVISNGAAARAEALRAAGVDELDARAEGYIERATRVAEQIDRMRPTTIAGVLALLNSGSVERDEQAIAGLREIAAS